MKRYLLPLQLIDNSKNVQELLRRVEALEKEKADMSKQLNQCLA